MDPILRSELKVLLATQQRALALKRWMEAEGISREQAEAKLRTMELEDGHWKDEVMRLIQEGRKIDAIKRAREVTGLGLKECKEMVEMVAETGTFPDTAPATPQEKNWQAEVEAALRANQKIEAIKLVRQATGLGLKEAKDLVEQAATQGRFPPTNVPTPTFGDPVGASMEEARRLMRDGRKIDAIKRVRQATGLGLKEAKEMVEQWQRLEKGEVWMEAVREALLRGSEKEARMLVRSNTSADAEECEKLLGEIRKTLPAPSTLARPPSPNPTALPPTPVPSPPLSPNPTALPPSNSPPRETPLPSEPPPPRPWWKFWS